MQTSSEPVPRDANRIARAKRRVAALKAFYIHVVLFVLVLAGLVVVNAFSGGAWWVLWVFFGWGIGVAAHALAVFGRKPRAVSEWEERKVREFVNERK